MSKHGSKVLVPLLRAVVAQEIESNNARDRARELRALVEQIVWNDQPTNPNAERPVESLELSVGAEDLIPEDVHTLGELCQHTSKDLLGVGQQ